MAQDIFDLAVILILVFYALRGFLKGFVVEAASLVGFFGGLWAAAKYYGVLLPYLDFIATPAWRTLTACALLFFAVIIFVSLAARLLRKIISFSFVGWADHLAGFCLGLAKGILIVGVALMTVQNLLGNASFLHGSRTLPYFHNLLESIRSWLPPELVQRVQF